jgi:hypothetical protein
VKNKSVVQFSMCLNCGAPHPSSSPNGYFIAMLPQEFRQRERASVCSCNVAKVIMSLNMADGVSVDCIFVLFNYFSWRTGKSKIKMCLL